MEAILKNPEHPEYGTAAIPVPLSIAAEEYEESMRRLAAMGIGDPLARDCAVEEIRDALPVFDRLKGQRVNADELDYLGKRMESFDCNEEIQFSAMAHIMGLTAVKDLINLTFCVSDVTVIRNFSNLASEGKLHYLHIHGGASEEELRNLDPVKLVSDLIANSGGAVTPYGVAYHNGMVFRELYKGSNFPAYHYTPKILSGTLSKSRQPKSADECAALYFPMPDSVLTRTLIRAGWEESGEPLYLKLELEDAPAEILEVLAAEWTIDVRDGVLDELNAMCRAVDALPDSGSEKLGAAIRFAEPRDAAQIMRLAENLDLFEFVPGVATPEEYGKYIIQESGQFAYSDALDSFYDYGKLGQERIGEDGGKFNERGYVAYHGELSLEELMMDDPSEPLAETAMKRRLSAAEKGVPRRKGAER